MRGPARKARVWKLMQQEWPFRPWHTSDALTRQRAWPELWASATAGLCLALFYFYCSVKSCGTRRPVLAKDGVHESWRNWGSLLRGPFLVRVERLAAALERPNQAAQPDPKKARGQGSLYLPVWLKGPRIRGMPI